MPENGPLVSPNPLYEFETDPQRILEVAGLIRGILGGAYNTGFTICEDGYGANETVLDTAVDLDFGNPRENVGILSRIVRLRSILTDDLSVDMNTYTVQVKEQIATSELDGPLSIHEISVVCPHDDSEEAFSIRHSYVFPSFDMADLLDIDENGEFDKIKQQFGTRIKNSFIDPSQMAVYEVNDLMDLLQEVRYDAPQQPHRWYD